MIGHVIIGPQTEFAKMHFMISWKERVIKHAKTHLLQNRSQLEKRVDAQIKNVFAKSTKMKTIIMITLYLVRRWFLHTSDANCMLQSIDDVCKPFYMFLLPCYVL